MPVPCRSCLRGRDICWEACRAATLSSGGGCPLICGCATGCMRWKTVFGVRDGLHAGSSWPQHSKFFLQEARRPALQEPTHML